MEPSDTAPVLLATSWTSAGDVRPFRTAPTSPVSILERVAAAAAAGYRGIGFGWPDLDAARDSIGWEDLAARIWGAGLGVVEVEFLDDWWLSGRRRERSDAVRRGLLEAAQRLGATHIKAGCGAFGDTRDHDRLLHELRRLGDEAADHGTRIAVEPGAGSALDLTGEAVPLLRELAHPAVGLMLDPWHLVRAGLPYGQALSGIDPGLVVAVELSDGLAEPDGPLLDDTFDRRLPPGDGAFGVREFVRIVRDLGFDGPWGVEVMSDRTRSLPIEAVLAECRDAALRCLGTAAAPGTGG